MIQYVGQLAKKPTKFFSGLCLFYIDFDCVIDNEIHEFVKTLLFVRGCDIRTSFRMRKVDRAYNDTTFNAHFNIII